MLRMQIKKPTGMVSSFFLLTKLVESCAACLNQTADDPTKEGLLKPAVDHTCDDHAPGVSMHQNEVEAIRKAGSCCPNMTPFVLMIALSVHSVFEGLAVGITDNMADLWTLLLAIVIHKGAASSALGISLVKTFPNDFKLVRWLVFTFSLATPLGIILGMML